MKSILLASVIALGMSIAGNSASAGELIGNSSLGYYNANLGDLFTINPSFFPGPNVSTGDPTQNFPTAPDLSGVIELGDWLSNPGAALSNGFWSGLQSLPSTWDVNTETAIIYEIDGGSSGIANVVGSFGVDNQLFVWVNGEYRFGATAPGPAIPGEYLIDLGSLNPGTNFIQVLRGDHGSGRGYTVSILGDVQVPPADIPEPASALSLFVLGVLVSGNRWISNRMSPRNRSFVRKLD